MIGGTKKAMAGSIQYQDDWKRENTVLVGVRINKNQDPELFERLQSCKGSKSALIRDLIQKGLDYEKIIAQKKA